MRYKFLLLACAAALVAGCGGEKELSSTDKPDVAAGDGTVTAAVEKTTSVTVPTKDGAATVSKTTAGVAKMDVADLAAPGSASGVAAEGGSTASTTTDSAAADTASTGSATDTMTDATTTSSTAPAATNTSADSTTTDAAQPKPVFSLDHGDKTASSTTVDDGVGSADIHQGSDGAAMPVNQPMTDTGDNSAADEYKAIPTYDKFGNKTEIPTDS